jgi:hypothetical protein
MEVHVGNSGEVKSVYLALCRVQGDNPYLTKMANTGGANGYYACKWCYCQGSNQVVTPDGQSKEDLGTMRSGGYNVSLPCTLHTIKRHSDLVGRWEWEKIENHCLRNGDGTLDTAQGRLMVTTDAAVARAATAEHATQLAVDNVAQKVARLANPKDVTVRRRLGMCCAAFCSFPSDGYTQPPVPCFPPCHGGRVCCIIAPTPCVTCIGTVRL